MAPRKKLGQVLLELGVIDEHQLQSALGHQKQWGGKLGGILVQKGFCAEDDVVSALTKHLGMQRIRLADAKVDPRALKCVSKQIAERLHVLPYEISGSGRSEVVTVAMSDPLDLSAVDQLAFHTGKRIKPMLAGDGEIIAAIHAHYGGSDDNKKEPTDKVARPGAPAAAPGAPAGSVAGFPKRIDPVPAAAPAAGRAAPYIPPPIPSAKPAAPVQKLDEIEPDEAMRRAPSAVVPPAVDLPADDGQDFGLEPIAAHSQFGDAVSGQEEVAGEGKASDAVEGLVSASVAHAGAAEARQMDGFEAIAAPDPAPESTGWTGPILAIENATAGRNGSGKGGGGQTAWDVSAPAPADGWAAEPLPSSGWTGPVQGGDAWASPSPDPGADGAGADGWSSPEAGAPDPDAPGEALPPDAILGTAPIVPPEDAPAAPSSGPPIEFEDAAVEADAPDAWASSEDPLAAEAAVEDPVASRPALSDPLESSAGMDDPLATSTDAGDASVAGASADALDPPYPAPEPDPLPEVAAHHGGDQTDRIDIPPVHDPQPEETPAGFGGGEATWIGESLAGGTPLSPADLGTLSSIGVDPGDGVGALRLLAVLVRILNRNQLIEPDDLREEIRESRIQGAAAAGHGSYGMHPPGGSAPEPAET